MRPRLENDLTIIDRRPLGHILAERARMPAAVALAVLFLAGPLFLPVPEGLTMQGWRVIGVFCACITLWVLQAIPLGATGLLALTALPWASDASPSTIFSYFGNKAVFFLIAAFLLAAAVRSTGISVRLAIWVFRRFGRTPRALATAVMSMGAFLSLFMPEHAVAAMIYPILHEVVDALGRDKPDTQRYATRLYLALVWGVVIGGIVTLLGGARGPLALGILQESHGQTITFLEWIGYTAPVAIPLFLVGQLLLNFSYSWWPASISHAQSALELRMRQLGRMRLPERTAAVVLLSVVVAWIVWGEHYDLAAIGLMGVILLVLTRAVSFDVMQRGVDWSVIFLYGGAIALGKTMIDSGAASYLATQFVPASFSAQGQLVMLAFFCLFLTEFMSNAAVVALVLPVALGDMNTGLDPKLVTITVALTSGIDFTLPTGTPAMSMAYASGFVKIRDTFGRGVVLALAGWLFVIISLLWIW